jgi:competence ComEA-like helix-hairpin-helix protein
MEREALVAMSMLRNGRIRTARAVLWATALLMAGDAQAQNLPDGPAKLTVQSVCSQCHSLSFITNARLTKADWEYVVTDMIGRGAPLMEDEISSVIDYLAANFPRPAGKVNVNTAGARDLHVGLGFTPKEADAIVAHREKNGKFAAAADVSKVAGVDAKKVDAARDRMEF